VVSLLPDDDDDRDRPAEADVRAIVAFTTTPPDIAAKAVRDAVEWVEAQLVSLRAERTSINDQIRGLVIEQARLRRLVRVLDAE
jgi:hypothetical protein